MFSLGDRCRVTEEGAAFRSHLDGAAPADARAAVDIQARLGADIAMVLDECPPFPRPTTRRARIAGADAALGARARPVSRSRAVAPPDVGDQPGQAQFGIVQGGVHADLREAERRGDPRASASRATRSAA